MWVIPKVYDIKYSFIISVTHLFPCIAFPSFVCSFLWCIFEATVGPSAYLLSFAFILSFMPFYSFSFVHYLCLTLYFRFYPDSFIHFYSIIHFDSFFVTFTHYLSFPCIVFIHSFTHFNLRNIHAIPYRWKRRLHCLRTIFKDKYIDVWIIGSFASKRTSVGRLFSRIVLKIPNPLVSFHLQIYSPGCDR